MMKSNTLLSVLAARLLSGVLALLVGMPLHAGSNVVGTNPTEPGGVKASTPGEEVVTLPMVREPSGLAFVGPIHQLRGVLVSIHGQGTIHMQRLPRGRALYTVEGDFRIELDRAALARSEVAVFFRGGSTYSGGVARLKVASGHAEIVDASRVRLPIPRLAGVDGLEGLAVQLGVLAPGGHHARVSASLDGRRVHLLQRVE